MIPLWDLSIALVAIPLAFMMYTCLYGKGNPLYSIAEESYIGVGMGLSVVTNILYIWRVGVLGVQAGDFILAAGLLLGLLMLVRIKPEWAYLTRVPISMTVGTGLALSIRTVIFTGVISQLKSTIVPLVTGDLYTDIVRFTVIISILCQMTFFLYTTELTGPLHWTSKAGEYFLYAGFGGVFAQTFMGRLGLLIGFMQNVTFPTWKTPITLVSMFGALAIILILDRKGWLERLTPET